MCPVKVLLVSIWVLTAILAVELWMAGPCRELEIHWRHQHQELLEREEEAVSPPLSCFQRAADARARCCCGC